MDLLVPAPMPDICVRLWKSCPRPASHVVPRLTDRLHRDRTAILMPSIVRSSGAPPLVSDGKGYCCRPPCVPRSPTIRLRRQRLLLPSSMRSSGSPPFVSDFGKLPPYDRSPPSRRCGNLVAANPLHRAFPGSPPWCGAGALRPRRRRVGSIVPPPTLRQRASAGNELSWVSVASRGHLECTSFQEPINVRRGRNL